MKSKELVFIAAVIAVGLLNLLGIMSALLVIIYAFPLFAKVLGSIVILLATAGINLAIITENKEFIDENFK